MYVSVPLSRAMSDTSLSWRYSSRAWSTVHPSSYTQLQFRVSTPSSSTRWRTEEANRRRFPGAMVYLVVRLPSGPETSRNIWMALS